jgi:hypothetical protein
VQRIGQIILIVLRLPWIGIKVLFYKVFSMLFGSPPIQGGMKKIFTFYALNTTEEEQHIILAGVGVIGAFFGGIHCIGWNYIFPTRAEETIWHVSSITITGVPALVAFSALALYAEERLEDTHAVAGTLCIFFGSLSFFFATVGVIPYILARVLLLVEAFISLRDLPTDALLAVRWTSFLPHF